MAFLGSIYLSLSVSIFFCIFFHTTTALNKYSAEANKPKYEDPLQFPTSLRELDKPFRMAKLNVLWVKAKNVSIVFITLCLYFKITIIYCKKEQFLNSV